MMSKWKIILITPATRHIYLAIFTLKAKQCHCSKTETVIKEFTKHFLSY